LRILPFLASHFTLIIPFLIKPKALERLLVQPVLPLPFTLTHANDPIHLHRQVHQAMDIILTIDIEKAKHCPLLDLTRASEGTHTQKTKQSKSKSTVSVPIVA